MTVTIITGDCRSVLRTLPDESVHCVVTSPPYWGLRDYGVAGQIGLEPALEQYLDKMVEVFQEVRRVLSADGTLWLNLGDTYAGGGNGGGGNFAADRANWRTVPPRSGQRGGVGGLKPKDLVGMPWRVAFALQANGWWLRQDIIWSKPNPMPETIKDRCTKAHEYIFLLSKSERYFYDAEAIKEPASENTHARKSMKMPDGWDTGKGGHGSFHRNGREKGKTRKVAPDRSGGIENNATFEVVTLGDVLDKRNKRSVWTVATKGFAEAHFATFPPALIEPCVLAGCPVGGTVLDPFGGAGTTGMVADRLQRNAILIELNPTYAAMARRRIDGDAPLFAGAAE